MVLQPIVDVGSGALVAAEALARFAGRPDETVDETFALAYASGRGAHLEAACIRAARAKRAELAPAIALTLNVSPDALMHESVKQALAGDLTGVIVEITEHASADLAAARTLIDDLRRRGAKIAVDDTGTGYAGLLRLTEVRPDIVKLDRGLVTGVRTSLEKSAVIEALVSLSHRMGAQVLGEGVQTQDDLIGLAELGVDLAQGWFIAMPSWTLPAGLPEAVVACRAARTALMRHETLPDTDTGLQSITAALAGTVRVTELSAALAAAASSLGVDLIGLSTLTTGGVLREVSASTRPADSRFYRLSDFPATKNALVSGNMVEAHVDDLHTDPAERAQLLRDGMSSLLVTPVISGGRPLGVLELQHRSHRRWTTNDMTRARMLAQHVAGVLARLERPQLAPAG
jgi:EAL domain-containing protein (putative c-di-GMP-specific phosphodiesterase class I)